MKTCDNHISGKARILLVFTPFMLAYLISELYRNVNGVIAPALRQNLNIGPEQLGLLSSVFLLALALVQIPAGLLLDRCGSRRTVASFMVVAALGAWLFTLPDYRAALAGRLLMGVGLGACWAGAYRANVLWWPAERLALANGALLGLSGLGALLATLPTEMLLQMLDWQTLFQALAAVTLLLALLIWTVVPTHPSEREAGGASLDGLMAVMRHPLFMRLWPMTLLCEGSWLAWQGLWAGGWMREVVGLSERVTALYLLGLATAIVVGQLLLSAITDRLLQRGVPLIRPMRIMSIGFVAVQGMIVWLPLPGINLLWIAFGLLTVGPILTYAWLAAELPSHLSGRLISLLNMAATLGGFMLQYAVGWMIELWPPTNGHYPDAAWRWTFSLVIALQILAVGRLWRLPH
ncbi:MFS transporter [Salinicola corii]|uniref:MFS transporter n=1 Tax=Salinicola corii TaxID=2606937 RepID=A0A640WCZ6_9GAMM|nr:MFS transporter [Salinicola corii]KAA0017195.1 MFS transporter [Salinicola corii]